MSFQRAPKMPPTNSILGYDVSGNPIPANPIFFTLQSEAQAIVQQMQAEGAIPIGVTVSIDDEPYTVGPVVYGNDGRKVYVINWAEADGTQYSPWAGMLYYQLLNFPKGYGDWIKNVAAGDIRRVGFQAPQQNPPPQSATTYNR
jgi:hypothetical protein